MAVTIYHNPRCSKSRQTLERIRARGIEPTVVHYLETPPDAATLRELLGLLGLSAVGLARCGEAAWKDSGLDATADDEQVIALMVEHPVVIERPIVVSDGRAVLGRPPENVDALLDG